MGGQNVPYTRLKIGFFASVELISSPAHPRPFYSPPLWDIAGHVCCRHTHSGYQIECTADPLVVGYMVRIPLVFTAPSSEYF